MESDVLSIRVFYNMISCIVFVNYVSSNPLNFQVIWTEMEANRMDILGDQMKWE